MTFLQYFRMRFPGCSFVETLLCEFGTEAACLRADNDKTYPRKSSQGAKVKREMMVVSSTRMLALCLVNSGY